LDTKRLFVIMGVIVVIIVSISVIQYLSFSPGNLGLPINPPESPTTLKPSQWLIGALARTKGHLIGLIANGDHPAIEVVDLTEGTFLGNLTVPNPTHAFPWGIDFTPDGSTLLISTQKEILFVNWETMNITKRIQLGQFLVNLVVNPLRDEAYIFGNGYADTNLYILNLKTFQVTKMNLPNSYYYFAQSPDFNTLYVSSEKQIQFIDTENHTVRLQFSAGSGYFSRIILSPDGSRIYVSYLKDNDPMTFAAIREYDISSGKLLRTFENVTEHEGNIGVMRRFVVSPDGRRICIQEQSDKMIILNLDSGNVTFISYESSDQEFWGASDMVFSPDGSEIYLTYAGVIPIDSPGPTTPSMIGIYETTHFSRVGALSLSEGCYKMVLSPH
jgi:DNA-binding beta-propeller fold protein YncE